MYQAGELEIVLGKALARWSEATGYREALPPVWLREMSDLVKEYFSRLNASGKFEEKSFEEDVYRLISCFAVGFERKPSM